MGLVRNFFSATILGLLALTFPLISALAAVSYGTGYYTNICGTGTTATANLCNRGCAPQSGSCSASGSVVVRYTCDGRRTECRENESGFTNYQSVSGTTCGKTVQIDVYNKTCRANGWWSCNDGDMQDYFVWYSGDCPAAMPIVPSATPTNKPTATPQPSATSKPTATPNPTMTPAPTATIIPTATPMTTPSTCDELTITSGNNWFVPATVTLRARATDPRGNIQAYRFFFGDGAQNETTNPEVSHKYEVSGWFTARVDIKDSQGIWKTSDKCQTTVHVTALPIESHKSACSNIFIRDGNNMQAPTTGKFTVTGYDNKGSIQGYKVDFGNGIVKEENSGLFEQAYDKAGTYTVKGYIKDSKGEWKGGTETCEVKFYAETKPLVSQPKTGTPTGLTVVSLLAGLVGGGLTILQRKYFS